MLFIDVADKLARPLGFRCAPMPESPEWLGFYPLDATNPHFIAGRCLITDNQISRYAFDMITRPT